MQSIEPDVTSSVADMDDEVVMFQARIPEWAATRLRVAAAKNRQRTGQYLAGLVEQHVPEVK